MKVGNRRKVIGIINNILIKTVTIGKESEESLKSSEMEILIIRVEVTETRSPVSHVTVHVTFSTDYEIERF